MVSLLSFDDRSAAQCALRDKPFLRRNRLLCGRADAKPCQQQCDDKQAAAEAHRLGLVNHVVPLAELLPAAETLARKIIANPPLAVKFALEVANKGMETSQSEGLLLEASYFGLCAATEDKKEGTAAFLEKRAPQFRGR